MKTQDCYSKVNEAFEKPVLAFQWVKDKKKNCATKNNLKNKGLLKKVHLMIVKTVLENKLLKINGTHHTHYIPDNFIMLVTGTPPSIKFPWLQLCVHCMSPIKCESK